MRIKTAAVLFALFTAFFYLKNPILEAQSFHEYLSWSYNGSLVLLASDNGKAADPVQIVPSFGFSAAYPVFEHLKIEITEDLYFSNYEYNWTNNYPMACTPDNRQAFVLGFVTGVNATGFFQNKRNDVTFRFFGGITADLRIITIAIGLHPDDVQGEKGANAAKNAISDYFWGKGRFLFASGGTGLDFPVNEKFLMGIDLRVWYPLYRLWTGEDIPFIDGWRFGLGMRVTPRKYIPPLWQRQLRKPKQPPADESDNFSEDNLTDESQIEENESPDESAEEQL